MNINSDNKINIKPGTSVYRHYKYRNYSVWKALAEYIDNSTQNYHNNKELLEKNNPDYKLQIEIIWDKNVIQIKDNGTGMNEQELRDAMVLGKTVKTDGGRNQFGMGLKTASCWFAGIWEVLTQKISENHKYSVEFDVEYVSSNNIEELPFNKVEDNSNWHGTIVTLKNLNKRITKATVNKLKKLLSSVYRSDLETNKISISLNNEFVKYVKPPLWETPSGETFYREFEFNFVFENKKIDVKGNVGIAIGSTDENERGFAFFKNKRAIIVNCKDPQLVGRTSALSYQRIFGAIFLEGVDVTQDKSNFDWENGLKEEIFNRIEEEVDWFKSTASALRKPKSSQAEIKSGEIKEIEEQGNNIMGTISNDIVIPKTEYSKPLEKELNDANEKPELQYESHFTHITQKYKIIILGRNSSNLNPFLEYELEDLDDKGTIKVKVYINRDHDFYQPYQHVAYSREAVHVLMFSMVVSKIIMLNNEAILPEEKDQIASYFKEQENYQEITLKILMENIEKKELNND